MLAIHSLNGSIAGIETGIVDERKSLRIPCVGIAHDLRRLENDAKGTEDIVQQLLIDFRIQVTDEDVCTNIKVLSV